MNFPKAPLALALLAAAGAASAQSSVTVYGVIDLSVGVTNNGVTGNVKGMYSGVGPGSRIGFRGQEDLGGGLRAIFTLESGIAADTGANTQGGLPWGRQVFVGLATDVWSLTAGRQYSPINISLTQTDALNQLYWGSTAGTGSGTYQSPGSAITAGGFQSSARVNNSVLGTAKFGGFTGRLMVAAGDEGTGGTGHLAMLGATYAVGPVLVAGTYNRFRQYATSVTAGSEGAWQNEWHLGGSVDLGVLQAVGGYYSYDPSEANLAPGAQSASNPRFLKTTSEWLGVRVPVASFGKLMAQVMRTKFDYPVNDGKGTTIAAVYEHYLSKRTTLFASYAKVDNNDYAWTSIQAATVAVFPGAVGKDIKAYSAGIRHTF